MLPGFNDAHLHFISGGLSLETRRPHAARRRSRKSQSRIESWADAACRRAVGPRQRLVLVSRSRRTADPSAARRDRPGSARADPELRRSHGVGEHARRSGSRASRSKTPNPRRRHRQGPREPESRRVCSRRRPSRSSSSHVPAPTRPIARSALRAAIGEAQRYGITSIQNADGTADDLELFAEARRDGDLSVRVYSALAINGIARPNSASASSTPSRSSIPTTRCSRPARSRSSSTASSRRRPRRCWSRTPTRTEPGTPAIDADDFNRLVRLLDARGWQVLTHAVGDRAVRMALNAYEHAVRSNPPARTRPASSRRARRDRRRRRRPAFRRARRHRVDAAVPRQTQARARSMCWSSDVGPERASRGLALRQHRRTSGHARVRQRLAGRAARPDARASTRR